MSTATLETTKTKSKLRQIIEEIYFNGRQSINARKIYIEQGRKFKIEIKVDSYDFQSNANGYVWDEIKSEWKFVYGIPYKLMDSTKGTTYTRAALDQKFSFNSDMQQIQKQLRIIVL